MGSYVDLWPTEDEISLAKAIAKAITESLSSTADKMLETAQQFFHRLLPAVVADSTGSPQISFTLRDGVDKLPQLEEVLRVPGVIAKKRSRRVAIVFDEFQRVLEYGSDAAERMIRSAIQEQPEVSFVFLGSRKHLIQKMFLDQDRPLYRSGGHYPLHEISEEHWLPFVQSHFSASEKVIDRSCVQEIVRQTGGHPFYTQHLCHAVWELCESQSSVTMEQIQDAIALLLERESYAYTALWESFGLNQRRLLQGLAAAGVSVEVFGSQFLREHRLSSASSAQRAAESLLSRDVIDREGKSFTIGDRFFRIWILNNTAGGKGAQLTTTC